MATHLLAYKHHPVTAGHMFARAFHRRGDEIITIGTPWWGRRYSPAHDVAPDIEVPYGEPVWRANWIRDLPPVDAVWTFSQGFRLRGRVGEAPTVLYGTDPHVIDYRIYAGEYDHFFVAQKMQEPGVWIPLGYDPEYHRMDVDITVEDRPIDICFVGVAGSGYEKRRRGLSRLAHLKKRMFTASGLFYEEFRKPYNNAKIAYNWSSLFDIPMRFFEGMAMGCCVVTNRLPFIDEMGFVEGEHYISFDDEYDLERKVGDLLVTGKWVEIAKAGHEAIKDHTYDTRVQTMLDHIQKEGSYTARRLDG